MASVNPEQPSDFQKEAGTFLSNMDEMAPQIGLDYSVESLQRLDQFISDYFDASGSRPQGNTLALQVGSYVGEVIIRHLGGRWNDEGKPEINEVGPIEAVYPIDRAMKRFENGRQESLAWFYHATAKQAYEQGLTTQSDEMTGLHHIPVSQLSQQIQPEGGVIDMLLGFFRK